MRTIALIGDSIRFGYQPYVKQIFAGSAEIWAPEINGGDSRNVIKHLSAWMDAVKPDVVHINCGLHDLKKSFETGSLAVPLAEYKQNVQTILTTLLPSVPHVVWAMTTPVNFERHHAVKEFDRFEEDVLTYNSAAQAVTDDLNVQVSDLYSLVMTFGRDKLLLLDGVHFTEQGYAILAEQVCATLKPYV